MKGTVLGVVLLAGFARAQEVDCLIKPSRLTTVSSAINGVVDTVLVDRGDVVKQGQTLATLQSDVERANAEAARARAKSTSRIESSQVRLEFARRTLARNAELQERDVVSVKDKDQAESEKGMAQASLHEAEEAREVAQLEARSAEAMLQLRTIKSPVSGIVVERILSPGEYTDPPQIVKIATVDPLYVEVFAPLALVGQIRRGMKGTVLPEAPVGGSYTATVTVVDDVVDAASGTFGVRLELPNAKRAIPGGLRCRIRFDAAGSPRE